MMKYFVINTKEDLAMTCNYWKKCEAIGLDTETASNSPDPDGALEPRTGRLSLIQISDGKRIILLDVIELLKNEGYDFKRFLNNGIVDFDKLSVTYHLFEPLREVLENPEIIKAIHNEKFEHKWLLTNCGIELQGIFDTMLASIICDNLEQSHRLVDVASRKLGVDLDKTEQKANWGERPLTKEKLEYAALDPYYLTKLREIFIQMLDNDGLRDVATLEFEAVHAIAMPELYGTYVDREEYKVEVENLKKLRELAGATLQGELSKTKPNKGVQPSLFDLPEKNYSHVSLTSWQQVLEALQKLGVPVVAKSDEVGIAKYEREKKLFAIGTGAPALSPLVPYFPVLKLLSDFRGVDKMTTAFGDSFLEKIEFDLEGNPRVYANFKQIGAPTGRMSCYDPNLQQIPDKELEIGEDTHSLGFRKAFKVPVGKAFINADYSQIELRIAAEDSGDPIFLDAFVNKKDLHALTAALCFGVSYEDCCEGGPYYNTHRKFAKRVNFGIIYGIGPPGLAVQLKCSVDEAKAIIDRHRKAHPVLWAYLDRQAQRAIDTLQARTLTGRLQRFNAPQTDDKGEPLKYEIGAIGRNGKNMPIQGCLEGNSRVFIKGLGYKKIDNVPKEKFEIWEGDEFADGFVSESGKKKLVWINMQGGNRIGCSPEHKFWAKSTGKDFAWVEAKDLTKSHKIRANVEVTNFDYLKLEGILSGATNFEVGVLLSTFYLFGKLEYDTVILDVPELDFELRDILVNTFVKAGIVFDDRELFDINRKPRTRFILESKELVTFLDLNRISDGFEEYVWESKPLLEGILKTLFSFAQTDKDSLQLRLSKDSINLTKDLQQALYLFGIHSNIVSGLLKDFLHINKKHLYRYVIKIGIFKDQDVLDFVDYKKLRKFRTSRDYNTYHLSVESVEVTDEEVEMFDVVDSTTSRFMSNGLVTHNTSADILKRALKLLYDALRKITKETGYPAYIVNIVHDEISVECAVEIAEEVRILVQKAMIDAGEEVLKRVPVKVDAKIITNWGDK